MRASELRFLKSEGSYAEMQPKPEIEMAMDCERIFRWMRILIPSKTFGTEELTGIMCWQESEV